MLETPDNGTNTAVSSESSEDMSTNSIYDLPFLENNDFSLEESDESAVLVALLAATFELAAASA